MSHCPLTFNAQNTVRNNEERSRQSSFGVYTSALINRISCGHEMTMSSDLLRAQSISSSLSSSAAKLQMWLNSPK